MNTAEIESEFRTLPQAERLRLAAKLDFIIRENDPEYRAEISRRIARMERGEEVTAEELLTAHARLVAEGR